MSTFRRASIPPAVTTASSSSAVTIRARACPCCFEPGRSSAARGLRLRLIGADPLAVRLLLTRLRISDEGIDMLGYVSDEKLTEELAAAKLLVAPSTGQRELRHGAHPGFRLRDSGRRLRHPGLSRDRDAGDRRASSRPDDPDALAGDDRGAARGRAGAGRARARRARARGERVRLAAARQAARGLLRARL